MTSWITGEACWSQGAIRYSSALSPSAADTTAYSVIDGLALLDDDEVLGGGLEGVWEGSFGLFESVQSAILQPWDALSLRGNGETIDGLDEGFSSAQDRLSQIDGSCLSALYNVGAHELTVDETKSSLVKPSSQGVRVD
jgi:hypothetical protein